MEQMDEALLERLRAEAARLDLDEIRDEIESAIEHPDPVLAEAVAGALAKHVDALTPAGVEEASRLVTAMLLADPAARRLLDEARTKRGSGTVRRRDPGELGGALLKKVGVG